MWHYLYVLFFFRAPRCEFDVYVFQTLCFATKKNKSDDDYIKTQLIGIIIDPVIWDFKYYLLFLFLIYHQLSTDLMSNGNFCLVLQVWFLNNRK